MPLTFNVNWDPKDRSFIVQFNSEIGTMTYGFTVEGFFQFLKACVYVGEQAVAEDSNSAVLQKAAEIVKKYEEKQG